jgi:hypothetical protein
MRLQARSGGHGLKEASRPLSGPSKSWIKVKNPKAPAAIRVIEGASDLAMTDMPETFETFLRIWIAENIGSLGSQTDATNLKYILRVRADELEKAATIKGFYGELAEAARLMAALKATYSINLRKRIQAEEDCPQHE